MKLHDARITVTGGRGFLGRHLCAELNSAGARVESLGRADYDLRRRTETDRMLAELRPDAVIHLASVVGGIGANQAEPGRFLYENAVMGLELLEACRIAGVERVLVAGTVCAYPKFTSVPFREEELWTGYPEETNAPYGVAKKLLLVQAQAYREQYGMKATYVLPTNLYGPGDNFDLATGHVIPAMIRKFSEARQRGVESVELWGDGSATREFLFVRDAARAFRLALEHYDGPEPVNIGSGTEISIKDLAEVIARATGFAGSVRWDLTKPNGQPRRCLAVDRAGDLFGFRATTDFTEGIAETVAWYAEQRSSLSLA
jgi:GDP-L-fucose synthase